MVSALVSGSSGPGSSPGRRHCVVFFEMDRGTLLVSKKFVVVFRMLAPQAKIAYLPSC